MSKHAQGKYLILVSSVLMVLFGLFIGFIVIKDFEFFIIMIWLLFLSLILITTGVLGIINCNKKDNKSMLVCRIFCVILLIMMTIESIFFFITADLFFISLVNFIRYLFPALYFTGTELNINERKKEEVENNFKL